MQNGIYMKDIVYIANKMIEIDKRCGALEYQRNQINDVLESHDWNSMSYLEVNLILAAMRSYEKESDAVVKEIDDLKTLVFES